MAAAAGAAPPRALALGEKLPADVLAGRAALPHPPAPVVLEGTHVVLRPTEPAVDAGPLFEATAGAPLLGRPAYDADEAVWRWLFSGPFGSVADMRAYLEWSASRPGALLFTVIDKRSQRPAGCISFLNSVPANLSIEIGGIFYGPAWQGLYCNTEATLLTCKYAFELGAAAWGCAARARGGRLA